MRVGRGMRIGHEEVQSIVEDEEEGDHEALGDFDAVDAREDVDAVWAEDGDGGHVDVIEGTEVEETHAEEGLERLREHD